MKNVLLGILGIITLVIIPIAEAQQVRRPLTCMWNESSHGTMRTRSLPCTEFDSAAPKNFSQVCVFWESQWQLGALKYSPKDSKHTFVASRACELGVYVTQPSEAISIASPRMSDYKKKLENDVWVEDLDGFVTLVKGRYTSKATSATEKTTPLLTASDVPLSCYKSDVAGVASGPMPCTRDPNGVGYCELKDAKAMGTRHYAGHWWFRYGSANRKDPVLCKGGLKYTNINLMLAENGSDPEDAVILQTSQINWADFRDLKLKKNPDLADTAPEPIPMRFASCVLDNNKKIPCENAATAGFVQWQQDKPTYTANKTVEAEKTCYYPAGGKTLCTDRIKTLEKFLETGESKFDDLTGEDKPAKLTKKQGEFVELYIKNTAELPKVRKALADLITAKLLTAVTSQKFPIDKTAYAKKSCYIEWDPMDGNNAKPRSAFVLTTNLTTRHNCTEVEIVEKITP